MKNLFVEHQLDDQPLTIIRRFGHAELPANVSDGLSTGQVTIRSRIRQNRLAIFTWTGTMRENGHTRIYLSHQGSYYFYGHILPVVNIFAILTLTYYSFLEWGIKEELRSKIMVWIFMLSVTFIIQSLANTISNVYIEQGHIHIRTRYQKFAIPATHASSIEYFSIGIQGAWCMLLRFSGTHPIKNVVFSVDYGVTEEMIWERIVNSIKYQGNVSDYQEEW